MEMLIKQAFLHIDIIGEHVHQGHYDLTGPDGEIILPQVWETMIQPDWEIAMHMWPMEEEKHSKRSKEDKLAHDAAAMGMGMGDPFAGLPGFGDLGIIDVGGKRGAGKKVKDGGKKGKKAGSPDNVINVGGPSGPPPPKFPAGVMHGAFVDDPLVGVFGPGMTVLEEKKRAKAKAKVSPFAAWVAGGQVRPKRK